MSVLLISDNRRLSDADANTRAFRRNGPAHGTGRRTASRGATCPTISAIDSAGVAAGKRFQTVHPCRQSPSHAAGLPVRLAAFRGLVPGAMNSPHCRPARKPWRCTWRPRGGRASGGDSQPAAQLDQQDSPRGRTSGARPDAESPGGRDPQGNPPAAWKRPDRQAPAVDRGSARHGGASRGRSRSASATARYC